MPTAVDSAFFLLNSLLFSFLILSFHSHAIDVETAQKSNVQPIIAQSLGIDKLDNISSKSSSLPSSITVDKCLEEFGKIFTRVEPLSKGYYGSVYLAHTEFEEKVYAVKAIRIGRKSLFSKAMDLIAGAKPIDEVKIGKRLYDEVISTGLSGAFAKTLDWFPCNFRMFIENYCKSNDNSPFKCPSTRYLSKTGIDTQFIVMEYVKSIDIMEALKKFDRKDVGKDLTNFVRSLTFQTLHAMNEAAKSIEFFHFDLNFHNVRLQDNIKAKSLIESHEGLLADTSYFIFRQDQIKWKVPITHTNGQLVRIIDYGIGKVRGWSHNQYEEGDMVGSHMAKAYRNQQLSMQISMRHLFRYILISMPRDMIKRWKRNDVEGFELFQEAALKAIGYNNMNKFAGWITRTRPSSDKNDNPKLEKLGHYNFFNRFNRKFTQKYAEIFGTASLNAYNMYENLKDKSGVSKEFATYQSVMTLPFYNMYIVHKRRISSKKYNQ